jgi:hypothetical protein
VASQTYSSISLTSLVPNGKLIFTFEYHLDDTVETLLTEH